VQEYIVKAEIKTGNKNNVKPFKGLVAPPYGFYEIVVLILFSFDLD